MGAHTAVRSCTAGRLVGRSALTAAAALALTGGTATVAFAGVSSHEEDTCSSSCDERHEVKAEHEDCDDHEHDGRHDKWDDDERDEWDRDGHGDRKHDKHDKFKKVYKEGFKDGFEVGYDKGAEKTADGLLSGIL